MLKNILQVNLAMIFVSTSGFFGRYIDVPTPLTIGMRACIAAVALLLFCWIKGFKLKVAKADKAMVLFSGFLMWLHWITYFYALQKSNVAIGMLTLFTYPVLTALLEPMVLKTAFSKFHLLLGAMVLVGLYFIVPEFSLESDYFIAILLGLFSALVYALRNIIVKSRIGSYNGSVIMLYQLVVASVLAIPFFFTLELKSITEFIPSLLALGLITTALGHTLFLYSFRHFSTTTVSILSCTQPLFGILIGMLLLKEFPRTGTWIGGAIILGTIVAESIRLQKQAQKLR
ncbi:DMT family transporter [Sediminicola luteus]|nr:DMT family transporter [Sediminicola luteus]